MNALKTFALLLASPLLWTGCGPARSTTESTTTETIPEQHLSQVLSDTTRIVGEAYGDLNKDGLNERVIAYNTDVRGDLGIERVLYIYTIASGSWELLHESKGPVLPSENGGMMGEPFEEIAVERGCIVIRHSGGSRSRWTYTHRYRLQEEDWYLIGATIGFGEPPCTWDTYDYNLSNGNIAVKKELADCEETGDGQLKSESYTANLKLETLPRMDGFIPGEHETLLAETSDTFYY